MANGMYVSLVIGAALSASVHSVFANTKQTLENLGKTTDSLTARQKRLGEMMERAMQHPLRDIGALSREYTKLGESIKKVQLLEAKLNFSNKRSQDARAARGELRSQMVETGGTALAFGAPLWKSVKVAADFQDQLKDIAITGNMDGKSEVALGDTLRRAAMTTNQAQTELAKGVSLLVANGMSADQAGKYSTILGKTATATRASMEDTAQLVFSLQNSFKVETEADQKTALDALAYAGKQGQFELKSMARYFPELGAQMASFGATGLGAVKELGMAMQVARKYSGTNEEAARNVANWFAHMSSGHTVQNFAKVGIDFPTQVMQMMKDKNVSALQATLGVTDQFIDKISTGKTVEIKGKNGKVKERVGFSDALASYAKDGKEDEIKSLVERFGLSHVFQDMQTVNFYLAMRQGKGMMSKGMQGYNSPEAVGVIDKDFEKRLTGAKEQFHKLTINLTELGISLGEALLPSLISLSNAILPIVKGFADFAKNHQGLVTVIVGLIGGLLAGKLAILAARYAFNLLLTSFYGAATALAFLKSKIALLQNSSLALGGGVLDATKKIGAGLSVLSAGIASFELTSALMETETGQKFSGWLSDVALETMAALGNENAMRWKKVNDAPITTVVTQAQRDLATRAIGQNLTYSPTITIQGNATPEAQASFAAQLKAHQGSIQQMMLGMARNKERVAF